MSERGISVDHSTVHRWAMKLLPVLEKTFHRHKRTVGKSWRMDETYPALVQILREGTPILWRSQVYAARTEFQTAVAAWPLRLRRPKANWSLRIRRSSSVPAIVVAAQAKFLKPSMGLVLDLIPR